MHHENMISMLTEMGFEEVSKWTEPNDLGDKQYMLDSAGGKRRLTIGRGQAGDENCSTVFYFTLDSGEFLMFGTTHDSESDD